jgi:hypothetical protein
MSQTIAFLALAHEGPVIRERLQESDEIYRQKMEQTEQ